MKTRLLLVGSGSLARAVLRAIDGEADFELAGVAAPVGAEELAAPFGARAQKDYRRLLEDEQVDLVVGTAPTDVQADVAVAAAEFGRTFLCCGPPATSAEDAEVIQRCMEYGGGCLRAEALELFHPEFSLTSAWAQAFAPLKRVLLRRRREPPSAGWRWDPDRCGGGVLAQLGSVGLQFGLLILGAPVVAVEASLEGTEGPFGLIDTRAHVKAYAQDGALLELDIAWESPPVGWKVEVHGEGGSYVGRLPRELSDEVIRAWLKGTPAPPQRPPAPLRLLDIVEAAYAAAASGERCELPFRGGAWRAADYWLGPPRA